jgi:hypothetical protein
MIHKYKHDKWFQNDTATVKAETVMPLNGVCYAVYPDAVRMGLSGVNRCVAIFKYKKQAMDFGNSMWQDKWILKEVSL